MWLKATVKSPVIFLIHIEIHPEKKSLKIINLLPVLFFPQLALFFSSI
jgi:hypothetical protein